MSNYRPVSVYPRPAPKNKHKTHRSLRFLLVALLIFGVYHFFNPIGSLKHLANVSRASASSLLSKKTLNQGQVASMGSQINSIIAAHPELQIGVAVQDLNNNQQYSYGIGQPFVAASVAKALTATMYLHGVENGQYTLTQQIGGYSARYELQQMIEQSDNTAWANLNDLLTHDGLENYAGSIGFSNYDPDENTLTVSDISLLLSKIYEGQLLNSSNTKLLLSYMQNANHDGYIVDSVPAGVKVYHKAGWLDDRENDAAIIDNGKHPYVLVIFTKADSGSYDTAVGQQIFAQLTKATTQVFL